MSLFYKPDDGWAADCIPFYWQGEYHLFYLKDYRDKAAHGEGIPWFHLGTRDFVTFSEYGEALPRGTRDAQDLYVFTGCVVERDGAFHIFYTGHNPHLRAQGKPEQAVMHAVSDDLHIWRKITEDTFFAPHGPHDLYEPHDWRDPFVFWNAEAGEYWMLLAARLKEGPSNRRGCTALCASSDLQRWEIRAPFWTPGLYYTHECPDLFRMGDWWYLVFSEFSSTCVTRYRMATSLRGPWLASRNDTFDGRAVYAAKTASDGERRFVFGWNPTRVEERNDRSWQWGGNVVVHEVAQRRDGSLIVHAPDGVNRAFHTKMPLTVTSRLGNCVITATSITLDEPASFAYADAGPLPDACRIAARVSFDESTHGCGLMLRVSDDLEAGYYIRLESSRNRLVFDSWPRAGDIPFMVELERPLDVDLREPVEIVALVDGTVCEMYIAGTSAMSARLYDLPQGTWGTESPDEGAIAASLVGVGHRTRGLWGVFVIEGKATFDQISLLA